MADAKAVTGPVSWLLVRSKVVSMVRLPRAAGMVPVGSQQQHGGSSEGQQEMMDCHGT
jgi:hypothetical protein